MQAKQRVSAQRGRASCRFGCQRIGCDRISLRRASLRRKISTYNFHIREMSVKTNFVVKKSLPCRRPLSCEEIRWPLMKFISLMRKRRGTCLSFQRHS